jgi:hypothetical protein
MTETTDAVVARIMARATAASGTAVFLDAVVLRDLLAPLEAQYVRAVEAYESAGAAQVAAEAELAEALAENRRLSDLMTGRVTASPDREYYDRAEKAEATLGLVRAALEDYAWHRISIRKLAELVRADVLNSPASVEDDEDELLPLCGDHRQWGKSHDGECLGCDLEVAKGALKVAEAEVERLQQHTCASCQMWAETEPVLRAELAARDRELGLIRERLDEYNDPNRALSDFVPELIDQLRYYDCHGDHLGQKYVALLDRLVALESQARDEINQALDAELTRLEGGAALVPETIRVLQAWLDANECECPPEGHICGRPTVERLVAAWSQLVPTP